MDSGDIVVVGGGSGVCLTDELMFMSRSVFVRKQWDP